MSFLYTSAKICCLLLYILLLWLVYDYEISNRPITPRPFEIRLRVFREKRKQNLLLAAGILNRLSLKSRRDVIRLTWMKTCKSEQKAKCIFFTDSYDNLKKEEADKVIEENKEFNDMQFMDIKGGRAFGLRLVWMLQWFVKNYDFEYFLRVDDDYFICFDRLIYDVQFRPKNGLYWGWVHCADRIVRVDEGWNVLSRDIVDEALSKLDTTLLCHPYGDQTIQIWFKDMKLNIIWFADNRRIAHEVTSDKPNTYMIPEVCHRYLALHGTFGDAMLKYWNLSQAYSKLYPNLKYEVIALPPFRSVCNKDTNNFDVNVFGYPYHAQPQLCKNKPTWGLENEEHNGREKKFKL